MEPVLPFELAPLPANGLTRNLHRQLRAAILQRKLPPGFALPSTRRLAQGLGLGRNTAITVYGLLVAEGYVEARQGARHCVIGSAQPVPARARRPDATSRETDARIATLWRKPVPRLAVTMPLPARSFRTGVPENRHFDHATWRRLTARALRALERAPFTYGPPHGLPELREAIAGHVAFARAVACSPEDVVVTSGAQQAFDILARLLVTPGHTCVAVENPGYPPTRAAMLAAGARLIPVPVDAKGMRVDRVPDGVKVICVTPSHQSPTGAVMPRARRMALLARARELGASIIEDDYDGEYLYDKTSQDALQMMDADTRVFYVGTFSKSLFPTLRKGFVVAPAWARDALIDAKYSTDSHCDLLTQATLATFISEGHLARHIRRMRPIYSRRWETLASSIDEHLSRWLEVLPGPAGLHLTARIRDSAYATIVESAALQHLPGALSLAPYTLGKLQMKGLCIGYGCAEVEQITHAVRDMGRSLRRSAR